VQREMLWKELLECDEKDVRGCEDFWVSRGDGLKLSELCAK
jgi:hypothetical protein